MSFAGLTIKSSLGFLGFRASIWFWFLFLVSVWEMEGERVSLVIIMFLNDIIMFIDPSKFCQLRLSEQGRNLGCILFWVVGIGVEESKGVGEVVGAHPPTTTTSPPPKTNIKKQKAINVEIL